MLMPPCFSGKILRNAINTMPALELLPLDLSRDVTSRWGATPMQEKWIKFDQNTMYVDLNGISDLFMFRW